MLLREVYTKSAPITCIIGCNGASSYASLKNIIALLRINSVGLKIILTG